MSFLTPFVLAGLGALAVPVLIHLIQRERSRIVAFPSLMFIQRIPYQSVRRRRIRQWPLLLLRAAAIALIVLAFARPFFKQTSLAAAAAGGAKEVVILLDHSASMGYGDHWQKAKAAARGVVAGLGADDRATLVLFGRNAEEEMRATSDRARLDAAIDSARVTSDGTRFGPALKLADSILGRSPVKRREAVLISDFQKIGWTSSDDARFPQGTSLSTISVASDTANVSVPSATFARSAFAGEERVAVTAGLTNRGDAAAANISVVLSVDGHDLETKAVTVAPHASTAVTFAPFTVSDAYVRGTVRAGTDLLAADNTFHFVLSPSAPVPVAIVDAGERANATLYLKEALAVGTTPAFQVEVVPAARVTPTLFAKRAVVIFNNTPLPTAAAGSALEQFVDGGGGVLVVAGERTSWPNDKPALSPGLLGMPVDRLSGRGATLGYLDYSHPVFDIFRAPRSGDFSTARIFRYRAVQPNPASRVLARYDDGGAAAVESRSGAGRVILWTSTLDDTWTDLPTRPVYLPLVHQLVRYLARYEETPAWLTVGQVVDLASAAARIRSDRVVVSPAGTRTTQQAGGPGLLELNEQGVYEIRSSAVSNARPQLIAVNLDPAESDLTPIDIPELVAAVTGRATPAAAQAAVPTTATGDETEQRQGLWWYLLFAGLLLLAAETALSNRLSRSASVM